MAIQNDPHAKESGMDYTAHEETYAGVMHLTRWFVVHAALILVGLYAALVQGSGWGALIFIGAGVVALIWGIATTNRVAQEVGDNPENWHSRAGTGDDM